MRLSLVPLTRPHRILQVQLQGSNSSFGFHYLAALGQICLATYDSECYEDVGRIGRDKRIWMKFAMY